ncbi:MULTISPECIES: hypothetical protein [unclassified Streptomyces]|uniref:hypothetical protein n=1 Tax=Streptomyces sp. NPDC127129 TaxID=3345373 RepID=UPI003629ECF2
MKAGRRLRFSAVLVVVVLALTGFQTGKSSGGSGGKSRGGSSGGGCSSSKKKNNDHDYDDDLSGGDSGGSSGGSEPYPTGSAPSPTVTASSVPAEVTVVDCVKFAQKKRKGRPARKADTTASVRITSRATVTETFRVELEFQDAGGMRRDEASEDVIVGPGETKVFDVAMESPSAVDRVRTCEIAGVSVQ